MNTFTAKDVMERLKKLFDVDSDSALSITLDATPQTISTWKSRNSVPYAKCVQIAEDNNISLDWLIMGKGAMYLGDTLQEVDLSPQQQALLTLFNELNEAAQQDVLNLAKEKKHLLNLEKRITLLEMASFTVKNM